MHQNATPLDLGDICARLAHSECTRHHADALQYACRGEESTHPTDVVQRAQRINIGSHHIETGQPLQQRQPFARSCSSPSRGKHTRRAGWVKKITGLPVITVGSIGLDNDFLPDSRAEIFGEGRTANIDGLIERLEAGEFDLAAVGRALIANPDWANKVRDDASEELVAFEKEMLFDLQ